MPLQAQASIAAGFNIKSPAMKEVYEEVADFAFHQRSCILFGPSGSGKEYVARYYYSVFKECCGHEDPPFIRLNCVGIPETLAMSELFGIENQTATGVKAKRGLFQGAEGGVLFIDEVGDLPRMVEAMLLRAVDTEINEAQQLGGSKSYSTERVTVICATEQPPSKIRPSLLDRFENQVFVPGLDDRPEDLEPAVNYFTLKAFLKRRDLPTMLNGLYGIKKRGNTQPCAELLNLAERLAGQLLPLARKRTWDGSFRVLRSTIDYAVLRAKIGTGGQEQFIEQAEKFFKNKGMRQTIGTKKTNAAASPDVRPGCSDDYEDRIHSAIAAALPHADGPETKNIARFLSRREGVFKVKDFELVLAGLSRRTAQDRLKVLADSGVIVRSGQYYRLVEKQEAGPAPNLKAPSFLPLPEDAGDVPDRRHDLDGLHDLLDKARAVYISGARGSGKTACAKALGYELKTQRNRAAYYYSFDERGVNPLLGLIDRELINRGITVAAVMHAGDAAHPALSAAILSGYVHMLFSADNRPVLILDNADLISQAAQTEALLAMLRYWHTLSFVLVGKKLGNELIDEKGHELVEYQITAQPAA